MINQPLVMNWALLVNQHLRVICSTLNKTGYRELLQGAATLFCGLLNDHVIIAGQVSLKFGIFYFA
jgi:hypothetical protein